jgi:hypothetical protein
MKMQMKKKVIFSAILPMLMASAGLVSANEEPAQNATNAVVSSAAPALSSAAKSSLGGM